ncbi:pyridoxal phosphate-dependent aminotransferase [Candidatus Spongiihabitans sp.]|uniref:pyridoxal phosphate-dependent aminotransferase n=1 Tax=Candidatus Spongiihabitans sp. TaxID=3101308 RepID=UPI003C79FE44
MKFSTLTRRISGESVDSWAVHYAGLARREAGEDVIILSVGQETDEYTDDEIVSSAIASLRNGRHHYAQVEGALSLRQAIAKRHNELTGQGVDESNCAVFAGAQNALFAAAQCVLEHGDEVILIEPYYTTYLATFTASGATLVSVVATAENNFQVNPDDVLAAITERTKAIVLNSPNNPTGAVYTLEQFKPIVDACVEKEIWLINDEVYQEILLPQERASPASLPGADRVCVTVSSLSKSHRMTGWRLGWIVGPKPLMENLYNLSMCMAYGLPEFIMDAAVTAFQTGAVTAEAVRKNMDSRRKIVVDKLQEMDGLKIFASAGGMYVVLDVRASGVSSRDFARNMLDQYDVAVLPCDGFGESGRGLIRVSLCVPENKLIIACERIIEYVKTMKQNLA